MQTLKFIQQHNCIVPFNLGNELGSGVDGQCFEISNDPEKVIKICVLYDTDNLNLFDTYCNQIEPVIKHLINNYESICVKIFEHEYLGSFSNQTKCGDQKYILYYYTMEKLIKISEDEEKVFHSILSHEDRLIKKNFTTEKVKKMLIGLRQGLDFDMSKVIFFYEKLQAVPINHLDLHPRNIMKNLKGNFKLIDFDRSRLTI